MARARRPAGYLEERILGLLNANYPRPLTARRLTVKLLAEGHPLQTSLIFRSLRRLVDRGEVRKILVAGGYVPVRESRSATLWCHECGEITEIGCDEALDELDLLATTHGLAKPRVFVEFAGICERCAQAREDR